jgi:hypothetical protein
MRTSQTTRQAGPAVRAEGALPTHHRTGPLVHPRTYYVSVRGNNLNPGTRALPLRTIQAGVDKAYAGDTVMILAGTYREQVTFPRSGAEGMPVVVRGDTNLQGKPLAIVDDCSPVTGWTAASEVGSGVYKKTGFSAKLMLWKGNQIIRIHPGAMAGESTFLCDKGFNILNYDSAKDWHPYSPDITTRFWPDVQTIYGVLNGETTYIRNVDRTWSPETCDLRATEDSAAAFTLDGNDYITLEHLKIQGYAEAIVLNNSSHNVIQNCLIRNGDTRTHITWNCAHNTIRRNRYETGYGDYAMLGEWASDQPPYSISSRRAAQYALSKYVESEDQSSTNHSIDMYATGVGNVVDGNVIDGGNIGVWAHQAPGTTVRNNAILHHSSVGFYLDIGMSGLQAYDNDFIHNNIAFRVGGAGADNDTATGWFYSNRSYDDSMLGQWLKWYAGGYDRAQTPNFWFYHNSVAGFAEAMSIDTVTARRAKMVNNIFSARGVALNTSATADSVPSLYAAFDYNFCGGLYRGTRYQAWMFLDRHNQWASDTMAGDYDHQVWPLGAEPDWTVPGTSTAYQSGLDLSDSFTVRGVVYGPLPGLTPGYFPGVRPNLGAVQNTSPIGIPQSESGHGSVTRRPELAFAPNPTSGRCLMARCAIPAGKVGKLAVRDVLGRTVKSMALVTSGITRLDLRSFAPGIYIAALDAGGSSVSRKVIIAAH